MCLILAWSMESNLTPRSLTTEDSDVLTIDSGTYIADFGELIWIIKENRTPGLLLLLSIIVE